MELLGVKIISICLMCVLQLILWLLLCLAVTAIAAVVQKIRKKKLTRRAIKLIAYATICFIMLILLEMVYFTMYRFMQFSVWLLSCLVFTVITVAVLFINKKIRKKKPIHWVIKLVGYTAFYAITLFVVWKTLEPYPGNWLATDKEYRELAYELYNLNLDCYVYEGIREGSRGEIVLSFMKNSQFSDQVTEITREQRDYIAVKTAVEEYTEVNDGFREKRINIAFFLSPGDDDSHIYNFDPRTGEMGADVPYWFVTGVYVNNCAELAENYHDFSGISGSVETMDGVQNLADLCNLTYLQMNISGTAKEDKDLVEQYLEELNTLLPDCEIYINQYNSNYPAWEDFPN